ncbi:hypothetical protein EMPS_11377 [Entomortierella parvispora]|uniref:Pectate lyase superfamily protein domain-containing protein n=1 Tax=Entomortierella parvispora TaxID=205924 RepID=A0A9P3HM43_9FUNG|nr:hypothetical protein EMPS_11377 [Entomortierella parvispora]
MMAGAGAVAVIAVLIACTGMAGITAAYLWKGTKIMILTVAVLMATLILTGLILALALVLALMLTPESTAGHTHHSRTKDVPPNDTRTKTRPHDLSACGNPKIQSKTVSSEMPTTLDLYTDPSDSGSSGREKVWLGLQGLAQSPDAVPLQRHVVDSESSTSRVLSSPHHDASQPKEALKKETKEEEQTTTPPLSSSWLLSLSLPTPQSWAVTRSYYARMWERTRARIHQCYRYRSSPSSQDWTHPPQPYNHRYSLFCNHLSSPVVSTTTNTVSNGTLGSGNDKLPSAPHVDLSYVGWTSPQENPTPWSSILSAISCSRPPRRVMWGLALFFLVTVTTAETTTASSQSEGTETTKLGPLSPFKPSADQLEPLVAGVPPPPRYSDTGTSHTSEEEAAYIERLERQRYERQGSFYLELMPEDLERLAASQKMPGGKTRYSKEPLPWEVLGLDEDEEDMDSDDTLQTDELSSPDWSSPWGGAFRYEALDDMEDEDDYYDDEKQKLIKSNRQKQRSRVVSPKDQASQKAFTADNNDGSSTVDDETGVVVGDGDGPITRLELTTEDAPVEVTQELKMEEVDSSGTDMPSSEKDPNVKEGFEELIVPQIWNAEGVSQKGPSGTQEYIETTSIVSSPSSSSPPSDAAAFERTENEESESEAGFIRPKLDQIDYLGHEAEIDWLNEQYLIQKAWKAKHRKNWKEDEDDEEEDEEEDEDEEDEEEEDEDKDEDSDESYEEEEEDEDEERLNVKSIEDMFKDHMYDLEHGGLHSFHLNLHRKQARPNRARIEKQDIDVDGTLTPKAHSALPHSRIVFPSSANDSDSPLAYGAYNRQGDRIMDFSLVGWNEGNTDLPIPDQVPVIEQLYPRAEADSDLDEGDDYDRIQSALDRVSKKTAALVQDGTMIPTGALVLARGVYRISKPLKIQKSGLLFRGDPIGGTRIVCQWEPTGPRYAIEIIGKKDKILEDTRVPIVTDFLPVGSYFISLDPAFVPEAGLEVGDKVIVTRVGNKRWIQDIGMDDFDSDKKGVKPWKPMKSQMYRTILSFNPQSGIAQMDAPLPISISGHYGGGWVTKYQDRKIRAIGVQFLDMVFPGNIGRTTDEMLDEKGRGSQDYRFSYEVFANYALRVDQAQHLYITHITSAFFHNFISVGTDVHHITMDSIVHSYPDDMLSGQSAFQLSGQFTLIRNTLSQGSYHFYVDISQVMGPNVVHRSQATNIGKPHQPMPVDFAPGEIGPHSKFCAGMLFDQVVTDGSIQIVDRGDMGSGQGFAGANSVVWNSRAREGILTHRARGFQNLVIGSEDFEAKDRMPWQSHGWREHLGREVLPGSLYLHQLHDRLKRRAKGWLA